MPLTLKSRIGHDSIAKMEAAATRRYAEAQRLSVAEPLGAIYLFGYTVEMRLKTACYRLANVPPGHNIEQPLPGAFQSPRKQAENQIRTLLGLPPGTPVGHHLDGWMALLADTRALHALGALDAVIQGRLIPLVQSASLCWTEILRYRATRPYDEESEAVAAAARFLKVRYRRLWS